MKLNPKKRNLVITIALCAGVVAYVMLVFLPTQRSISALQTELATHQMYIAQQQQQSATLISLQQEVNAARDFSSRWRENAPDVRRLARLNAVISDCAAQSEVQVLELDPQPPERLTRISRVPIRLVCEGEFEQVFDFLRRIELLPHSIWFDEIVITSETEAAGNVHCELALTVFADKRENSN